MFPRHFVVSARVMSALDRWTKHGAPLQRCCGWFRKARSRETPMGQVAYLCIPKTPKARKSLEFCDSPPYCRRHG